MVIQGQQGNMQFSVSEQHYVFSLLIRTDFNNYVRDCLNY